MSTRVQTEKGKCKLILLVLTSARVTTQQAMNTILVCSDERLMKQLWDKHTKKTETKREETKMAKSALI